MRNFILKLNHIIFWWYYNRVNDHFKQWTFFKSVKLLIQNYDHLGLMHKGTCKSLRDSFEDADSLRKELSDIKIKMIASDDQIRSINKSFGTNWTPATDN